MLVATTFREILKINALAYHSNVGQIAEEYIRDYDFKSGFLGYDGFQNTMCMSLDKQLVDGIPSSYKLKDGDILSCYYDVLLINFHVDLPYASK
ncbi:hypothetical protein [Ancylomarina sp. 16SWW S1-10-2]|uniref:hypothetical protein n=1 Tax=Ancylomarina sp. 16SWW S1-10-2 TaxID=2499681 RepID=UPI0012AD7796|nr:hypothetical protein [Ancylomarina sp. 16SWW S1-10-2]MRT91469.1 hypothetical protein [Ancylomarina sp. 16SWW S1-10-2]